MIPHLLFAQEQVYFNNLYNPQSNFAMGRGVIENDNGYICLFGTKDNSNTWYSIGMLKISKTGTTDDLNVFGSPGLDFYASTVGGTLIKTLDGNLAFAFQVQNSSTVYSSMIKADYDLDTIWKKDYNTENYWTMIVKCKQTSDSGYILVGNAQPDASSYYDFLLIKTDSEGNEEWHQNYGGNWAEHGTDVIQTPDGGYLIGGFFWKPGYTHSLNAMVVKSDSMGNEEWTKYYGNPNIDDDMALVAMADDGNYLVATVYGEIINTPYTRSGRIYILKIDNSGGIIWDKKVGVTRDGYYMKNFRITGENEYIANGWSKLIDSSFPNYYPGWILKLDQNGDSLWYRDYYHFNGSYDENHIYDVSQTSDNGYITVGKANVEFGTEQMWVLKLDSMGCDTPGCALGTNIFDAPATNTQGLMVWPNPTSGQFSVLSSEFSVGDNKIIRVYDTHGINVYEIEVPAGNATISIEASGWTSGLYYLQYLMDGEVVGSAKIIRN
ncbi:MAG: T9SS type A sorting domain-containing protein [Bacteroidetes bacterium]|nr:T9SS type A sorting domain-containing protein [Bacteroidota bacterium]